MGWTLRGPATAPSSSSVGGVTNFGKNFFAFLNELVHSTHILHIKKKFFSTFFSISKASLSVYLYISLLRSSRIQRPRLCPRRGRPAPAHTEIHRTASSGLPSLAAFVLNTNSLSWTRPNAYQMRNKFPVVFTLIELH